MKKLTLLTMVCVLSASAQFKQQAVEQPRVADSFIQPQTSTEWFSFFNPDNFHMRHMFSASYTSIGGQGIALERYTNSMLYQFAPNLNAQVDISFQNSPYSTLDSKLQSKFSSIYLNRAEINYKPWKNTEIRLSYRQYPNGYYGNGYYPPFGGAFSGLEYEGQ